MKRTTLVVIAAVLSACLAAPEPAEAQGGMGEWFSELSGPEFAGFTLFYDRCWKWKFDCEKDRWTIRHMVGFSVSTGNEPAGTAGDIDMVHAEVSVVHRRWSGDDGPKGRLAFSYGLSRFYFSGTGFRSFDRYAPTVGASVDFGKYRAEGRRFTFGAKFRIFTESFNGQDFGGTPTFESGVEPNFGLYLGASY